MLLRRLDAVLALLMRPRVRRVRRWAFLVTVPGAYALSEALGVELSLGTGLWAGLAVALLDVLVLLCVAFAGARLLGPERRDLVLDLLMHPVARRVLVGEARMLATYARALLPARRGARFAYHRGGDELGMVLALVPATIAEGVVLHLLLPGGATLPKLLLAGLHLYAVVVLVAWALGPRVHPHRLVPGVLEVRSGPLYRARVPVAAIAGARRDRRRRARRSGVTLGDGEAWFATSGRVDVTLDLRTPVQVERPIGDAVPVTTLHVAVDDPEVFLGALAAAEPASPRAPARPALAWLAPADVLEAL